MSLVQQLWGPVHKENFFRKEFFVSGECTRAVLRIYVDTGYELFLNGRLVARVDEWNNARDYDVRMFLRPGRNAAAVHAINSAGHRGFAFELRINDSESVVSDGSWKVSGTEKWGWMLPEYEDASWQNAEVMDMSCAGVGQWKGVPGDRPEAVIPVLNATPFFQGELPKGVDSPFFRAEKSDWKPSPEICTLLGEEYVKSCHAPSSGVIGNPCVLKTVSENGSLSASGDSVFTGHAPGHREGPWLLLDFGAENVGFFRMRIQGGGRVHFRITYGESVPECLNPPSVDEPLYRMLVEEGAVWGGTQEWESRMRVGFRFVRIEFFHSAEAFQVDGFSLRTSLYPVAYKGFFSCGDALLNQIWNAGRKTVHLCMQEYYLDAVKRDRLHWVGDTYAMARFNYFLFADTELFRFCWKEMASVRYADGSIPSAMGEGSSLLWDYVGCWIAAFHDYYQFTGDATFPLSLKREIYDAVNWLSDRAGTDGLISVPANPLKVWMVTLNTQTGHDPYMNELYRRSLETALCVARLAGDSAEEIRYAGLYERTASSVRKLRAERPFRNEKCMHCHVTELGEIVHEYFESKRPSEGLALIRDQWGAYLLGSGMDTLMEGLSRPGGYPSVLDPAPEHPYGHISLCHGWAASPCEYLITDAAGIRPLEPGFRRFSVDPVPEAPRPLKAVVPTPHGEIALLLDETRTVLMVPPGTTGVFHGIEYPAGKHVI